MSAAKIVAGFGADGHKPIQREELEFFQFGGEQAALRFYFPALRLQPIEGETPRREIERDAQAQRGGGHLGKLFKHRHGVRDCRLIPGRRNGKRS